MANQLTLTVSAINKLVQAQQSGSVIKIKEFSVTDSPVDDQSTYGNQIYKSLITNIESDSENNNTVKILATIPAVSDIQGVISKAYLYDEQGDIFAYGLVPKIELTNDTSLEAELEFYLTFSNTSHVELAAPIESFVDSEAFNKHNHDEIYYKKIEVNNLLNQKSDSDHNHNQDYYLKSDVDLQIQTISNKLNQVINAMEPIGHIGMFYALEAPNNYLKIDGSWWSKETYQDLWLALQGKPNVEQNSNGIYFRIGDARGLFPRFLDGGRGIDIGRSLGSYQGDVFKSHSHAYNERVVWSQTDHIPKATSTAGGILGTRVNHASAVGGSETRPKNIAFLACIKYRLLGGL